MDGYAPCAEPQRGAMPMLLDNFKLDIATASGQCAASIGLYYDAVLAYRPFTAWSAAADKAIAEDPRCPMARTLAADCAFCQGDAQKAKKLLEQLIADAGSAGDSWSWREHRYVEAWDRWVNHGDPGGCFDALSKVVARHPADLFAVKRGQIMGLILGDGGKINSIVQVAAAAESSKTKPPPKYFHGMLAFGLEQQGCYQDAEKAAREGLAFEEELGPDAWLDHGLAHALYFQGDDELDDALEFLQSRSGNWMKEELHPFLYTHCWWHLALLHCESRAFKPAIAIFDEHLWPDGPGGREQGSDPQVQLNALNLLWRLETRGHEPAKSRWRRVLDGCRGLSLPSSDGKKGSCQHSDLLLDILLVRALCVTAKDDPKPLDEFLRATQAHANALAASAGGAGGRAEAYGTIAQHVSDLMRTDLAPDANTTLERQSKARKQLRELKPQWGSLGGSEEQRGVLLEAVEGPVVCGDPEKNFSTLFF